jgi:hypothetical protein
MSLNEALQRGMGQSFLDLMSAGGIGRREPLGLR